MSPSIILHQTTKSIFVAYSECELTFEVNLPTNLGELTFKNTSKWVIDHFGHCEDKFRKFSGMSYGTTFENECLEGKMTFGDPFEPSNIPK